MNQAETIKALNRKERAAKRKAKQQASNAGKGVF